jgi:hypothetical protein
MQLINTNTIALSKQRSYKFLAQVRSAGRARARTVLACDGGRGGCAGGGAAGDAGAVRVQLPRVRGLRARIHPGTPRNDPDRQHCAAPGEARRSTCSPLLPMPSDTRWRSHLSHSPPPSPPPPPRLSLARSAMKSAPRVRDSRWQGRGWCACGPKGAAAAVAWLVMHGMVPWATPCVTGHAPRHGHSRRMWCGACGA